MSRYLERAQQGCRLLADQLKGLEDRSVEEIDQSWRRLYLGLGRTPTGGDLESSRGDDRFMFADAYTLADDLTFEPENPDSIRARVATARENARQVRNVIGRDMWSCLNIAYLGLREVEIQDVWNDRPDEFYLRTEDAIRMFWGIVESSMYRDDGWHFVRLGRFVERAQLVAALGLRPTDGISDQRAACGIELALVAASLRGAVRVQPPAFTGIPARKRDRLPRLGPDALTFDPLRTGKGFRLASGDCPTRKLPHADETDRHAGRVAARIDYDWPQRNPGRRFRHEIRASGNSGFPATGFTKISRGRISATGSRIGRGHERTSDAAVPDRTRLGIQVCGFGAREPDGAAIAAARGSGPAGSGFRP